MEAEAIKNIDKEDERFYKLLHTIFDMCELSGFKLGRPDPTACKAIKNIDKEDERFDKLFRTIFDMCELSGFKLQGRIVLVDENRGRVWRWISSEW